MLSSQPTAIINRQRMKEYRETVLNILGSKCTGCGIEDKEVLQTDHINNDGNQDRKHLGSYFHMMSFYSRNELACKTSLQLLCANCHLKKTKKEGLYNDF